MNSVVVTVRFGNSLRSVDLELPGEVPIQRLMLPLVRVVQGMLLLPAGNSPYQLASVSLNRILSDGDTLISAGVRTGDILLLAPAAALPGLLARAAVSQAKQPVIKGAGPVLAGPAVLRTLSGRVFNLDGFGKVELTIGRYDPHLPQQPDIDLSSEPAGKTVSRTHAMLRRQGNQWVIIALQDRNRTEVGSVQLALNQPYNLKPGDIIILGGTRLVFEASSLS